MCVCGCSVQPTLLLLPHPSIHPTKKPTKTAFYVAFYVVASLVLTLQWDTLWTRMYTIKFIAKQFQIFGWQQIDDVTSYKIWSKCENFTHTHTRTQPPTILTILLNHTNRIERKKNVFNEQMYYIVNIHDWFVIHNWKYE